MISAMRENQQKLIKCKDKIFDEHNKFKSNFGGGANENASNLAVPNGGGDAYNALSHMLQPRTSALQLAKANIANRRSSVVIRDNVSEVSSLNNTPLPKEYKTKRTRQSSHFANQVSVELNIAADDLPADFNPFGGNNNDTSSDEEGSSHSGLQPLHDQDIDYNHLG